jgi:membrane dipeptidase
MGNLARGLAGRGYADTDISKVLGGNWMNLFEEVWNGDT